MNTLESDQAVHVAARDLRFDGPLLHVSLSDGRIISIPFLEIPWLSWLADASDKEKDTWSLEPGGFAVYWPDLDDGFEVEHLLIPEPIV